MKIYYIRHAQSANNRLYDQTGSTVGRSCDPELTDTGHAQVQRLAQFLGQGTPAASLQENDLQNAAGFGITHIYTSLMTRAVITGVAIAQALGLPLTGWEDLHECGGVYLDDTEGERIGQPGPDRAYFERRFPALILPPGLNGAGWWNRPYESLEERPGRARRVLNTLLARHSHTDDRVAVISHGNFYHHFMLALLNIPASYDCWFALNNTGITRVDFSEGEIVLAYLNRVDFLPREMVT